MDDPIKKQMKVIIDLKSQVALLTIRLN